MNNEELLNIIKQKDLIELNHKAEFMDKIMMLLLDNQEAGDLKEFRKKLGFQDLSGSITPSDVGGNFGSFEEIAYLLVIKMKKHIMEDL